MLVWVLQLRSLKLRLSVVLGLRSLSCCRVGHGLSSVARYGDFPTDSCYSHCDRGFSVRIGEICLQLLQFISTYFLEWGICSDRILTFGIRSIRSPAKVGLVVTDLITSPVVSWRGWETPPPSTAAQLSFFAQPRLSEHLSLRGGLPSSSASLCLRYGGWTGLSLGLLI